MHYPAAKAFLEAGIHVICDKPLTWQNRLKRKARNRPNGALIRRVQVRVVVSVILVHMPGIWLDL